MKAGVIALLVGGAFVGTMMLTSQARSQPRAGQVWRLFFLEQNGRHSFDDTYLAMSKAFESLGQITDVRQSNLPNMWVAAIRFDVEPTSVKIEQNYTAKGITLRLIAMERL